MENDNRERLLGILRDAVIRKPFKLSSGRVSDYYIDLRMITLDPEGSALIAELIVAEIDKIKEKFNSNIDAICGMTLGADPICGSVAALSYIRKKPVRTFIIRKEPKAHGTMKQIEGPAKSEDRVVIVDDVATTWGSILKSAQVVRSEGMDVVCALVVVDRAEGASEMLEKEGIKLRSLFTRDDLLGG